MSSATNPGSGSGFLASRVVQVHPTLRCNLACAHCYSSSGPDAHKEIEPQDLIARLERLRREGYDVVSFSGGEPLLYCGLDHVAQEARQMGYRVNVDCDGELRPICYEMPGEQRIAGGALEDWERGIDVYTCGGASALRQRLERAFEGLDDCGHNFVDWHAHVAERRFAPPREPRAVELEMLGAAARARLLARGSDAGHDDACGMQARAGHAQTTRSRPPRLAS